MMKKNSDMDVRGWIKLHHSLRQKFFYSNSKFVHLWIELLMCAKYKNEEAMFGGRPLKLSPGQFITGRRKLASTVGFSESTVERILNVFEREQQIRQQKNSVSRLISIVNWEQYQEQGQQNGQQKNNKKTADGQRVDTIKEDIKEYKEDRVKKEIPPQFSDVENFFLEIAPTEKQYPKDFFDHYTSNGWRVGKNKMVDWKASCRRWVTNDKKWTTQSPKHNFKEVNMTGQTAN